MWPWSKMNEDELATIAGGHSVDIPGLEAIGPYVAAGSMSAYHEDNELPRPKPIT